MDQRTTTHMIAKVIYHNKIKSQTQEDMFHTLVEVDKSIISQNLIYYHRIIKEQNVTIVLRNVFNNRMEDMSKEEIVLYFDNYGCGNLLNTLCGILKEFHSMNIVCGAIKMSNIVIQTDDQNDKYFYLCDYCMKTSNLDIEENDINYVSPEELSGKEFGVEIDIWCVGVLLYYILSGFYPFEGKNESQTMKNIQTMGFPKLKVKFNEILNSLLSKMLEKSPNKRLSITELEEDINRMNNTVYLKVENEDDQFLSSIVLEDKNTTVKERKEEIEEEGKEEVQERKEEIEGRKEEEEKKEEEENNNGFSSLASLFSAVAHFATQKASEIRTNIAKGEELFQKTSFSYKEDVIRRQAQLQADIARRQIEIARRQAEFQAKMARKQAEIQSRIAKSMIPNVNPFY